MEKRILDFLKENASDTIPAYLYVRITKDQTEDSFRYMQTYKRAKDSKWYKELRDEQREDGSFGRFHSMDSKDKPRRAFRTTEAAVYRMRDLMLPPYDTVVNRTAEILHQYISGQVIWSDRIEKQFGFELMLKSMAAANLSLLGVRDSLCEIWKKRCAGYIESSIRKDGSIDQKKWQERMRKNFDFMLDPYTIHIIWLLYGNEEISADTEKRFLTHLWNREEGIDYAGDFAPSHFMKADSEQFFKWLYLLEQFSYTRSFPELMAEGAYQFLEQEAIRIIEQDIRLPALPVKTGRYHENWRNNKKRIWDATAQIARLLLLAER